MEFIRVKYMGSKRAMLAGTLSETLRDNLVGKERFVDLFTGSGSVACYVAENFRVPVLATDLQEYAAVLARSIIGRNDLLEFENWGPAWIAAAVFRVEKSRDGIAAANLQSRLNIARLPSQALRARSLCANSDSEFVRAYGGWYFSPWQAMLLDALRKEVDPGAAWQDVATAAVVQAASRCVAAPGHTAQPFKAHTKAAPFLLESWSKDIIAHVSVCASDLASRHALVKGSAYAADANEVASELRETDLAFLDPPYSSVHYSRFYHVLESLARGKVGEVSGSGRYPAPEERPSSLYSIPTKALGALTGLLKKVADARATAVITFPVAQASNRLSGEQIRELVSPGFDVTEARFLSRFSTLGGDHKHRNARQDTEEMILTLRAR